MSQLTAKLYALSYALQLFATNTNAAALTSLHHHGYIRSCQTSLGMLLRPDTEPLTTLC